MSFNQDEWIDVFLPHFKEKMKKIQDDNHVFFAHYTDAETAFKIINKKEFWLRKTSLMNDFSETEYGFNLVNAEYKKNKKKLEDRFNVKIIKDFEELFNGWWNNIKLNTFIACFTEHKNEDDYLGKLSMWRAYGKGKGVALVLNTEVFFNDKDPYGAWTAPVLYIDGSEFADFFSDLIDRVIESKCSTDDFTQYFFHTLVTLCLSIKHPGFHEEKEWRIIICPLLSRTEHIKDSIEIINGIPQKIMKIPLKNIPEIDFYGVAIPELLSKLIIGPIDHGQEIIEAFKIVLEQAGVKDTENKIFYSNIPLRS